MEVETAFMELVGAELAAFFYDQQQIEFDVSMKH
jgi:hypothetical protein